MMRCDKTVNFVVDNFDVYQVVAISSREQFKLPPGTLIDIRVHYIHIDGSSLIVFEKGAHRNS